MKRQIYNKLLEWKHNPNHKPLILLGARQVGKTWIMKEFGRKEYKNFAYINCDDDIRFAEILKTDYDIPRILLGIQAITGVKIEPHHTLIAIDEIQEAPRGLHSLKYFCENAPEYDIIVAGSMLGVTLTKKQSFPVGKVDMLHMYPMDFEEFLVARNHSDWVDLMKSADWNVVEYLKDKLLDELRQYYFVGGMPEVVQTYIDTMDLQKVRERQSNILDAYRRSISKHASDIEAIRIGLVLDSLPSQLAKDNKKFIYGTIKKSARAKDFELAIQWLIDAGIVHRVNKVSKPGMPLKFYEDFDAFKLFLLDCGLLACLADAPASQMLISDNAFVEFKGAFAEQYVLQELIALNLTPYYWSKENSPSEIDFIVQIRDRILPIEVKAAENVRAKSLKQFANEYSLKALRVSLKGYVDQEWMENIPLYALAPFIQNLLK